MVYILSAVRGGSHVTAANQSMKWKSRVIAGLKATYSCIKIFDKFFKKCIRSFYVPIVQH